MNICSLYDLISKEKQIKVDNIYYHTELLRIKENSLKSETINKYYDAILLVQKQLCELEVSISYIMSLQNMSLKRRTQLIYYKKLISEKNKLYNQIVMFIQDTLLNNEELLIDFQKLIDKGKAIQKSYRNIASNNDLIIEILYRKFKEE